MDAEAKKNLFRDLYQLDNEESEKEDSSNASQSLREYRFNSSSSKYEAAASPNRPNHPSHPKPRLKHTVSAPLPNLLTALVNPNRPAASQFFPSSLQQAIGTADEGCRSEHTTALPSVRKRKRGRSLEPRPDSQQIFRGMSFFFFPNDDIAPARKLRIKKAMEFGALWVREWREGITHVVVDKGLCYQDILKFLKVSALPLNVVVVTETYPPSCISYYFGDFTVSSNPQDYRVEGHETAAVLQQSPIPTESLTTSLQLKPEKLANVTSQQTPPPTETSQKHPVPQLLDDYAHNAVELATERSAPIIPLHPLNTLEEAIEEAKAIRYLPLDLDDEDNPSDSHAIGESEGERSEDEGKASKRAKKGSSNRSWQQRFTCMSKHDGTAESDNPNARTIEVLQEMADYYQRHQDHWRSTAYRKAIGALKKQATKISSAKEALEIPFIGQRLADKIEEIVWTNRLRRLDAPNEEPLDEVFQLFMKIYGTGLKQATKWIEQGYRTLADLVNNASLTKNQKIGIEHFEDFQTRIPRQEMDRHNRYVSETCNKIDASVQFTIGGSYRRGAADSGDVDFIITKPGCSIEVLCSIVLKILIPHLFQTGYLKVGLATTDEESGSKWHGAAALPGQKVWRRIDFLLVPWQELGAALIYFTGNDIFNRSIRLLASKKGMRLNQRGLWKHVIRGKNREKITQGTLVESKDERKIFEILGVPWRPPHHRIC